MKYACAILPMLFLLNFTASAIVSFYGRSFIFQSVGSIAKNTTVLSLQFYTSSPNGIILHATGNSQYLHIALKNRQLLVKFDLGYGEEVLSLSDNQPLNNLLWHRLKLIRSGRSIGLNFNEKDEDNVQLIAPRNNGVYFNPNFGIFIGGIANAQIAATDGVEPVFFKGCLVEAKFNGRDLLSPLENDGYDRIVSNVYPGCPTILSFVDPNSLTFTSPSSYISLDRWLLLGEGNFECLLKTNQSDGIILYSAGLMRDRFVVLKMVDGIIEASVNKGSGVLGLGTTSPINDGVWHSVKFTFNPSYFDIRVDGNRTRTFFKQQTSTPLGIGDSRPHSELNPSLYIGGIPPHLHQGENSRRLLSLHIIDGKAALGGAFPGCIKQIKVNHRKKGVQEFASTHMVSAGCSLRPFTVSVSSQLDFWEASERVSDLLATYFQEQTTSTSSPIVSTTTQLLPTTSAPKFQWPQVNISTRLLEAVEGGSVTLTEQHISWTVSGMGQNISDHDILLTMRKSLGHGRIVKAISCGDNNFGVEQFSLKDVATRLLLYCHDGSDTLSDHFNFAVVWDLKHMAQKQRNVIIKNMLTNETEFLSTGVVLNQAQNYTFTISISPVDDLPKLTIPLDYVFRPVKNVPTYFSNSVLNATDPDSERHNIIYSVLAETENEEFLIENKEFPGRSILDFTQADLDAKRIMFTYKSDRSNARLILRLFNPVLAGRYAPQGHNSVVLRIAPQLLKISATVKKLNLLELKFVVISDDSISVSSNSEPGSVNLFGYITEAPTLGVLEVKDSNATAGWSLTSNFTMNQLAHGRVRYRNVKRTELAASFDTDGFDFRLSAVEVHSPMFHMAMLIKRVNVFLFLTPLVMDKGVQEVLMTHEYVNVSVNDVILHDDRIQIGLEKETKHVQLFYNDKNLILGAKDSFTYHELKQGRISLRVKARSASHGFQELIQLFAVVDDVYFSSTNMMNVTYVPHLDRILLLKQDLRVDEGREMTIGIHQLKASLPPSSANARIKLFQYQVLQLPKHGMLKNRNPVKLGSGNNISLFYSSDLERNTVSYVNDGSEATKDFFTFRVSPVLEGHAPQTVAKLANASLEANYSITIVPVNDQRPLRVVNRLLEVCRNCERLLTLDDICYKDADSDNNDLDLWITKRGITNGEVLNATSRAHDKITRFTQRQILNSEVLFQHRGEDNGRFVFWVRDGKHHVPGLITISASDPYLRVSNSSVLTVIKDKEAVVSSSILAYVTNVKGSPKDIIYRVIAGPHSGVLYLDNAPMQAVTTFTQKNIYNEILKYKHRGASAWNDEIKLSVVAGSLSADGVISIKIQLESLSKPPSVQKNRTISVVQGRKVEIRKQNLRVIHPDFKAGDIKFNIVEHPRFGELIFLSDVDASEFNANQVTDFTQADINHGKVWYSQNKSSVYTDSDFVDGMLLDGFVFNVTNGLTTLPDQSFYLDIIPQIIPLRVGNITVGEGKSKAITKNFLWIEGQHFETDDIEIQIVTQPSHGIFESVQHNGVALRTFNYRLVVEEFVYYAHDDSDSFHDSFSLQAFTTDRQKSSEVKFGSIDVISKNDERPIVVNNTGLQVWENSVTLLRPSALAAFDADTPPEFIEFQVLPASNGFLAVASDPVRPIFKFTQQDINNGSIAFVHKGSSTGGFTFQCNDGFEPTMKLIFVVTARPLIITVQKPEVVQAFPGEMTVISVKVISSLTNDILHPNRTITFTVTSSSSLGKLVKMDQAKMSGISRPVTSFTQQDVNDGLIFFNQDVDLVKWTATDSFVLSAASPPAKLVEGLKVSINITYYAIPGRSPIQLNLGQTVTEGQKVPINTSVLNAANLFKKLPFHANKKNYNLIYSIKKLPSHGNLSFSGVAVMEKNATFSQSDLENNRIWYTHDHSDTLQDSISFVIYLVDTRYKVSAGSFWVVPGTSYDEQFNITVRPLNDNPPVLLTKGKVLHVVDGFEKRISIKYLNSSDADSSPEEIEYSIIRQPSKGLVTFVNDPNTPIIKFNQSDVSSGKVLFVPNKLNLSNNEVLRDFFYFGITDGVQRSSYSAFQIKIHAIYLQFKPRIISLLQGEFSVIISADLLNTTTNGNITLLSFQVTQPSLMGVMMVGEKESNNFTYQDVLNGQVAFTLISNDITRDEIQIKVFYDKGKRDLALSHHLSIEMKALVNIPDSFDISGNGLNRIDLKALDASLLFERTGSMPMYTIMKKSIPSEILKLMPYQTLARSKRDAYDRHSSILLQVHNFTHQDVSLGYVFLSMKNQSFEEGRIQLRLSVEDQSVPPADFHLLYKVTDKIADDFTEIFDRFLPISEESTTADFYATLASTHDREDAGFNKDAPFDISTTQTLKADPIGDHVDETTISKQNEPDVKISKAPLPLWLPISIAAGSVVIILICATILLWRRKLSQRNQNCKTATYRNDNKEDSVVSNPGGAQPFELSSNNAGPADEESSKPLSSPACPGVTVTFLANSGIQDAAKPLLSTVADGIDDSPSYLASTYGPISTRDSQQSTIYAPSTVHHVDDFGSIEFAEFTESDIFSHVGDYRSASRLYHAKSNKFIDPDVLALYSSDESIPSMLDEKYAISNNKTNDLAGSVPSGLHKSSTNPASPAGISTSRSTASLSRMSIGAELALPPNSGLETNQYWI